MFDVIVIGSGPGGYVAAIRCAQLGLKTAIVERYGIPGGTCLNVGCIPSKALLNSSEHYYNLKNTFKEHGIKASGISVDLKKMIARKDAVIKQTTEGINYLFKKNKIEFINGHASFVDRKTIEVTQNKKKNKFQATNFIIATGSKPSSIPGVTIDKKRVITSTELLSIKEIPKHLLIIGAGVIGLELGSVYARLGSKVSIVEYTPSILSTMDASLGKELQKSLEKIGFTFYLNHKVVSVKSGVNKCTLKAENAAKKSISLEGDYCLVATGRKAYTDQLGLENIGVKTLPNGKIECSQNLKTECDNVFAIGDVIDGPMLAHKAEEEGIYVAEMIAGKKGHLNYHTIPGVVYTWPEVASTGFTEDELKKENIPFKTGSFPFKASGRARASMDTEGFVRVYAHAQSDVLLGVHIIGARAADLIAEAVLALEQNCTAHKIGTMCHPHPTYSEALKEACLASTANRAIHI
ncbi:MAG TPA: dihydrolipoyl dehydrogenase [Bacteroidia bacterium]|nr:dihydrolipoyl dehydrogenase [Bacteroidia bacterium]HNT80026.1 dihydrolipoyl dehydrogenase [Bacteroidia bacterium]